jgi:poly(A) polymerase/tRNA nucleotidyltransferase (CCA-adding enzyme)
MKIPVYILYIIETLEKSGYQAYPVGGCVRDSLLGREPKDWDVTTNALPEVVQGLFADARYENIFGTVILPFKDETGQLFAVVEITTFRSEQGYADRRHPDEIKFESELDKDLERRDFTINAMALIVRVKSQESRVKSLNTLIELRDEEYEVIDLFGGQKDLSKRIIRAVGEPMDRFKEDALRMMRAIRFSAQLGFKVEEKTERGIAKMAHSLRFVANERIADELIKILSSDQPYDGIMSLYKCKLLQYILPELEMGIGVKQNKHHIYTVFEHNTLALKYCPSKDWRVRLATLLHDVAKPQTKKLVDGEFTFYNHEYAGAKIATKIVKRLKFSTEDADKVVNLVKSHMFYYNVDEVTAAAVRRLIVKVGKENLKDLIDLRIGDRLGSGVAKAKPYKLRHLEYMLERVQNDPVSVKMLKINGEDIMNELSLPAGPKIGAILDVLLSYVLENPELNTRKYLLEQIVILQTLPLEELRAQARDKIEEKREADDGNFRKKHWVK